MRGAPEREKRTEHQAGREGPQPKHSMFNLKQVSQAPEGSLRSSHFFLRILQVWHPNRLRPLFVRVVWGESASGFTCDCKPCDCKRREVRRTMCRGGRDVFVRVLGVVKELRCAQGGEREGEDGVG